MRRSYRVTTFLRAAAVWIGVGMLLSPVVRAQAPSVRIMGSATKVRPTAKPVGAATASLVAAKNEFESFQVVIRALATPATNVKVSLSSALKRGSTTIPAANVSIYREAYYDAAEASDLVDGAPGLWPDALIPTRDRYYGEARNAFPITVPANANRVAWVDVLVPATAPPGVYKGAVKVSGTGFTKTMPVSLRVLDIKLSSTAHLRSSFSLLWSAPCQALLGNNCINDPAVGWKTFGMFTRAALDNRITISSSYQPGVKDLTRFRSIYEPLLTGAAQSVPELRPLLSGAHTTSFQVDAANLAAWRTEATNRGYADRVFSYACDEPGRDATLWATCKQNAQAAKSTWPDVPVLITATITAADQNGATGLIDLLVPLVNHMDDKAPGGDPAYVGDQRPKYDPFAAQAGKQVWMYTSCMSHGCTVGNDTDPYWGGWPGYVIDAPASEARAMGWLSYTYRTAGELYFETGGKLASAWTNQFDFGGNGDGTLFYPGVTSQVGGTKPIPIESLRLKLIRDGYEDYEYLRYLTLRGKGATARSIAKGLFPTTHDTRRSNDELQKARGKLIAAINALAAR
jgi:hypothetical protein